MLLKRVLNFPVSSISTLRPSTSFEVCSGTGDGAEERLLSF